MSKKKSRTCKWLAVMLIFSILSLCCTSAYAESAASSAPSIDAPSTAVPEEKKELLLSTVPDAVGKTAALAAGHVERRYELEQSLNEVVFENEDGTQTLYLFDYPVKYTDQNGTVRDVSLEIQTSKDGKSAFESAEGPVKTTFAAQMADGVTLSGDGVSVKMVPLVSETKSGASLDKIDEVTLLPRTARRVNDKKIAYAYDSKTNLEYTLTYTGFKEEIVVKEYTGQNAYPFILYTNGLSVEEMDGSYFLCDKDGEIRATIGDIIIFTADERNNAFGELTVQTIKENEIYGLTIHVDPAYMQDPATAYPLRIDPTIEITSASGSGAILDATINSKAVSAGASTSLYVGNRQTYGITRILMRFPGLSLSSIPSADNIQSASVEIRDIMCEAASMSVYAHIFTGNTWTEANVDWTTVNPNSYQQAALSATAISYNNGAAFSVPHRYSFNITDAVKGWKSGTYNQNRGIIFKSSANLEGSTTYQQKTFASFNRSSYQPSVKVTYTTDTGDSDSLPSGDYYLVNEYSNRVMDLYSNHAIQWPIHGDTNQIWHLTVDNNGYYTITPKSNSAIRLTESGGYAYVNGTTGNVSKWQIVKLGDSDYYRIENRSNGKVLTASSGLTTGDTDNFLQVATYSAMKRQKWQIIPKFVRGHDYYRIADEYPYYVPFPSTLHYNVSTSTINEVVQDWQMDALRDAAAAWNTVNGVVATGFSISFYNTETEDPYAGGFPLKIGGYKRDVSGNLLLGRTLHDTAETGTIFIYTDSIKEYIRTYDSDTSNDQGGSISQSYYEITFQSVALHEFGHLWGIDDFPELEDRTGKPNSIMRYPYGTERWWNGFRTSEEPQLVDYVAALHPEA